jgi:hypothetical protein
MGRYGKVWEGMGRYGKVWEGMGRYGKVWEGMGRYGKVWVYASKYAAPPIITTFSICGVATAQIKCVHFSGPT